VSVTLSKELRGLGLDNVISELDLAEPGSEFSPSASVSEPEYADDSLAEPSSSSETTENCVAVDAGGYVDEVLLLGS
jgi:hypothetical protein